MAGGSGGGQLSVPPGFRFHPTEEELLYYYLRKKVSYEAIDLDVIREVDLNKLEPWDLKEKCRIGTGPQNEWYFFSHKDKKYPTGTRTNRATAAGFWKATGRDKAIHFTSNDHSQRIGMRKTLVFYTGRAPHGHKTDWIMHEYRLDDDQHHHNSQWWVVCRVFKKKNQMGGGADDDHHHHHHHHLQPATTSTACNSVGAAAVYDEFEAGSMHLPQLFSAESAHFVNSYNNNLINNMNNDCSPLMQPQSFLRLQTPSGSTGGGNYGSSSSNVAAAGADWSFLDKLLSSHPHQHDQRSSVAVGGGGSGGGNSSAVTAAQKFPFPLSGCDPAAAGMFKFPQ
ncbi:unnamed protein product [Linum tenue]|uniref:NAC domain-containing protein n=1 Tax=Linum tenue TaxID=586396 RepID=A0AAV0K1T4_9ROSI|nr:unnamed protein product [Linum tenue]